MELDPQLLTGGNSAYCDECRKLYRLRDGHSCAALEAIDPDEPKEGGE